MTRESIQALHVIVVLTIAVVRTIIRGVRWGLCLLFVLWWRGCQLIAWPFVAGWKAFSSWRRRAPLIDYNIRSLEPGFRTGIRWGITVNGVEHYVRSIDELPEACRAEVRARLLVQYAGIREILETRLRLEDDGEALVTEESFEPIENSVEMFADDQARG